MFCEKCGTQVDSTQPFCPNCGNRIGGDPVPAPNGGAKLALKGPLFEKFNGMAKMEQLYFLITAGLLAVCFVLSMLKVYAPSGSGTAISMAAGASWLLVFATIYFTVAIGLVVLEYLDKLSGLWIWFFVACGAALILILYVVTWIAGVDILGMATSPTALSVGGWFFLIFQAGLTAAAVLLLIEKLKNRK